MKSKKICSFIVMCALAFGCIGFTQSKITTAYAMPSVRVATDVWHVYGEKDLKDDLKLVDQRRCPQGKTSVKSLINTCIRTGKTLEVTRKTEYGYPGTIEYWYYKII